MKIQEIHDKANAIINSGFDLNYPLTGIISFKGFNVKTLEDKKVMGDVPCIAVEFSKPLDPNLYFMNKAECSEKHISHESTYKSSQTYLEIEYQIIDTNTTTDAKVEFDFMIKDEGISYQYKAIAKTENNRQSYSYELQYIKNSRDSQSKSLHIYSVAGKDNNGNEIKIDITGSIPFIGIYNNDQLGNIKIGDIKRSNWSDTQIKDYNFSDPRGAFPNVLIEGNDNSHKIEHLKIGISHIALSFSKIEAIKNLELTFENTDENREKPIFKEYIDYRLKTEYIQDITNITFNITVWNLELAFSDYQLIKHHKLFTILAFNFNKKYLDGFLKKPYDKNYIEDKIKLYSALLQQAQTVEQKITVHRYVAYYSSRLDKFKSFIFLLTEDYNKITHPLIGIGIFVLITTTINTIYSKFDVIGITNITDIFKYRFDCSWTGFITAFFFILSIFITAVFGYLSYALSIAIKRRFGMGNPKDMS